MISSYCLVQIAEVAGREWQSYTGGGAFTFAISLTCPWFAKSWTATVKVVVECNPSTFRCETSRSFYIPWLSSTKHLRNFAKLRAKFLLRNLVKETSAHYQKRDTCPDIEFFVRTIYFDIAWALSGSRGVAFSDVRNVRISIKSEDLSRSLIKRSEMAFLL